MNSKNNETLKVALAIFAGAFIGVFLGLHYFGKTVISLLVGMMIGAGIGYISYEPRQVVKGIQHAWQKINSAGKEISLQGSLVGLEYIGLGLVCFTGALALIFSVVLVNVVMVEIFFRHDIFFWRPGPSDTHVLTTFLIGFSSLMLVMFNALPAMEKKTWKPMLQAAKWMCIPTSAVSALWIIAISLPKIIKFIHCEARVQTAVYAAIGTAVGWCFESPIIGASVGALLGVLGYRLVSSRFIEAEA